MKLKFLLTCFFISTNLLAVTPKRFYLFWQAGKNHTKIVKTEKGNTKINFKSFKRFHIENVEGQKISYPVANITSVYIDNHDVPVSEIAFQFVNNQKSIKWMHYVNKNEITFRGYFPQGNRVIFASFTKLPVGTQAFYATFRPGYQLESYPEILDLKKEMTNFYKSNEKNYTVWQKFNKYFGIVEDAHADDLPSQLNGLIGGSSNPASNGVPLNINYNITTNSTINSPDLVAASNNLSNSVTTLNGTLTNSNANWSNTNSALNASNVNWSNSNINWNNTNTNLANTNINWNNTNNQINAANVNWNNTNNQINSANTNWNNTNNQINAANNNWANTNNQINNLNQTANNAVAVGEKESAAWRQESTKWRELMNEKFTPEYMGKISFAMAAGAVVGGYTANLAISAVNFAVDQIVEFFTENKLKKMKLDQFNKALQQWEQLPAMLAAMEKEMDQYIQGRMVLEDVKKLKSEDTTISIKEMLLIEKASKKADLYRIDQFLSSGRAISDECIFKAKYQSEKTNTQIANLDKVLGILEKEGDQILSDDYFCSNMINLQNKIAQLESLMDKLRIQMSDAFPFFLRNSREELEDLNDNIKNINSTKYRERIENELGKINDLLTKTDSKNLDDEKDKFVTNCKSGDGDFGKAITELYPQWYRFSKRKELCEQIFSDLKGNKTKSAQEAANKLLAQITEQAKKDASLPDTMQFKNDNIAQKKQFVSLYNWFKKNEVDMYCKPILSEQSNDTQVTNCNKAVSANLKNMIKIREKANTAISAGKCEVNLDELTKLSNFNDPDYIRDFISKELEKKVSDNK